MLAWPEAVQISMALTVLLTLSASSQNYCDASCQATGDVRTGTDKTFPPSELRITDSGVRYDAYK